MNLCTRTSHAVATTSAMLRACIVLVIFELTRGGSALSLRTATTTQPRRLIYTDLHAYNAFRTSLELLDGGGGRGGSSIRQALASPLPRSAR